MHRLILSGAFSLAVLVSGLAAQTPAGGYHLTTCIKVAAGKTAEYRQFVNDYSRRLTQARADAGEIAGWALVRSVLPAGADARCDYIIITRYAAAPAAPMGMEGLDKLLKKAGMRMSATDFVAKRSALTTLVAQEMWQSVIRISEPQKGDYMFVNFGKVPNLPNYLEFEQTVWKPMAEEWVKDGRMRAWMVNRKVLPGGTEVQYPAVSVDVFPSWDAAFQPLGFQEMFSKVHAGKDYSQTFAKLPAIRDLARRELYVVEEVVKPAARVSQR